GASLDDLRTIDASYGRSVDAFLAAHGDTGQSSEGLGTPSWADDPSQPNGTIASRRAREGEDPHARRGRRGRHAEGDAARGARRRSGGGRRWSRPRRSAPPHRRGSRARGRGWSASAISSLKKCSTIPLAPSGAWAHPRGWHVAPLGSFATSASSENSDPAT